MRRVSKICPRVQVEAGKADPDGFLPVVRRLDCDEDKGRFEKVLGQIARAKPKTIKAIFLGRAGLLLLLLPNMLRRFGRRIEDHA